MENYRQVVVAYSIKHGQRPDGWWFVVEIPGRQREERGPYPDEDTMIAAKVARMEELERGDVDPVAPPAAEHDCWEERWWNDNLDRWECYICGAVEPEPEEG